MLNTENIQTIPCGAYQENAYLVCPDGRDDAFLVDPGDGLSALQTAINASGRTLSAAARSIHAASAGVAKTGRSPLPMAAAVFSAVTRQRALPETPGTSCFCSIVLTACS